MHSGPVLHTMATGETQLRVQPCESIEPRSWQRGWRIASGHRFMDERPGHHDTNLAALRTPIVKRFSLHACDPGRWRHRTALSAGSLFPSPRQGQAQRVEKHSVSPSMVTVEGKLESQLGMWRENVAPQLPGARRPADACKGQWAVVDAQGTISGHLSVKDEMPHCECRHTRMLTHGQQSPPHPKFC